MVFVSIWSSSAKWETNHFWFLFQCSPSDTGVVGDVTARRSKMHGEFVSLKQRPVTSREVFYRIKSPVARIFTA